MPLSVRSPLREYRTWAIDSRRWAAYRPRSDDIVIATYPKCGTTWMQQIVSLLIFQDTVPRPVMDISTWIDRRFGEPVEVAMARLEAQTHRRFLKSHLPADGLPLYETVRYIHVARDGRDASMSFHNHASCYTPSMLDMLDRVGLADEAVARPYPRTAVDPADHFHRWITEGVVPYHRDGSPGLSYFEVERSWWEERHRSNVLLVHYSDMKCDLEAEMRRIASFLDITVTSDIWSELVEAAGFDAMRRDGEILLGSVAPIFKAGGTSFFHQGINGRWRGILASEDLVRYDEALNRLAPDCAAWLGSGSHASAPLGSSRPSAALIP
jgi:aryl sulfotransferase